MLRFIKISLFFLLIFFLSGCMTREDQAVLALEQFEQTTHDIEYSLNQIKAKEVALQKDWEESLADSDDEMEIFSRRKGPVFDNINERQNEIKSIRSPRKLLQKAIKKLRAIESDQTKGATKKEVNQLINQLQNLDSEIQQFNESYEKQLMAEQDFFVSLAHQDIDFEQFNKNMNELNQTASKNKGKLNHLEDQLHQLQDPMRQLHDGLLNTIN